MCHNASWLCVPQVAEIISDVREPIMEASVPMDENMSRRHQVQVGNTQPTESPQEQLHSVILSKHSTVFWMDESTTFWHISSCICSKVQ